MEFKQAAMTTLGLFVEDLPSNVISNDDVTATWETMLMNTKNSEIAVLKIVSTTIARLAGTSQSYFGNKAMRD